MLPLRTHAKAGRVEVGCDEAGRGALAGPVVAAAVILPACLEEAGIQDSKKLSPEGREEMAVFIRARALDHAIGLASVGEVERLNVLQASLLAMRRALDGLRVAYEHILVDGTSFGRYKTPHTCVRRGDGIYQSIAAASILAKTRRDAMMCDLASSYPAYGWERNKGYGTAQHRRALREFSLSPHHRRTFSPCAMWLG